MAAVDLIGVSQDRGGRRVLDGLDLSVADGEFVALLGPSGCGKTTALRLIAGFDEPVAGEIRIGGVDVRGVPPYRRDVNLVFQDYALFPHLTVAQNVAFGLEMQRLSRKDVARRVAEALDLVRLDGFGARFPDRLSGGQQQRVALARALVRRPQVLLLDEPLAALDLQLRRGMQDELRDLQRRLGTAFVFVTHDQEEALGMADRVAVLDAGRLLQVAAPVELVERPVSRAVAAFIGDANLLDGVVTPPADARAVEVPDLGVLRCVGAVPAAGAAVCVCIRPERIRLVATAEAELRATVEDVAWNASGVRIRVRAARGAALVVRASRAVVARGDVVGLAIRPDDVRVLPS